MTVIGFHASHEQMPPSQLLHAVTQAEQAGFDAAMCSDHFAPWSANQGQSGYAWAWLGAALQATTIPFGIVTAPVQRYHPAVVAQAIATLGEMFPGRFWAALGSGEAVNESITGDPWPEKPTRDTRLVECADVIRRLLAGERVDHDGLVTVRDSQLWSRPELPPRLIGAAVSVETARRVGGWADGLITVNQPAPQLREVFDAFREGGGEGKEIFVQVHLSWDPDPAVAERIALHQWRANALPHDQLWDIPSVEAFDRAAAAVSDDDVRACVSISHRLEDHVDTLQAVIDLGVDGVFLHHVGQQQAHFIDAFGEHVLPALRRTHATHPG